MMRPLLRPFTLVSVLGVMGVPVAWGQSQTAHAAESSGEPDKSGYTLFDPTPTAQLRGFSTDRPNKGTSPYTVDAGHFQYETDLLGGGYDDYNYSHTRTRQLFTADPVLKLGVTNLADLEVSLGGYQAYSVRDHTTGSTASYDGFGDVVIRTKINLLGNDRGPIAIAVVPYYKIPTATRGLGNGAGEFGAVLPLQVALPGGLRHCS